jgi:energy-converting hydrogenase A subunit B
LIYLFSGFISAEYFIAGMVLAIFSIQGVHHSAASRLLGSIARKMGRI